MKPLFSRLLCVALVAGLGACRASDDTSAPVEGSEGPTPAGDVQVQEQSPAAAPDATTPAPSTSDPAATEGALENASDTHTTEEAPKH